MAAKKKATTKPNNKLQFTPASGYILIQPLKSETKTPSGIYLPDTVTEKPQTGKVIAVGDPEITDYGTKRQSPAKTGNTVIYKKWGGNEVKIGSQDMIFVRFEDILAIEK